MCEKCEAQERKMQQEFDRAFGDPATLYTNAQAVAKKMSREQLEDQLARYVIRDQLLRSHLEIVKVSMKGLETSFYRTVALTTWGSRRIPLTGWVIRLPLVLPTTRALAGRTIKAFTGGTLAALLAIERLKTVLKTAYPAYFDDLKAYEGMTTEKAKEILRATAKG